MKGIEALAEAGTFDSRYLNWGEQIDFPSTRTLKQYTHRVFNRYPARSISLVPRMIIKDFLATNNNLKNLNVLDPFMGSGTTAIEASLLGSNVFGVEIDPFARMISDVSTTGVSKDAKVRLEKTFQTIEKSWKDFDVDSSYAPSIPNIDYWFDSQTFAELLQLKKAILHFSNSKDLSFFLVVFADILRPCSRAERQSLKPYISSKHKKVPARVTPTFMKSYSTHLEAILDYSNAINYRQPKITWLGHHASNFSCDKSIDLAITSPPYINALDYLRCVKIESAWINCLTKDSLDQLRKNQIGQLRKINVTPDVNIDNYVRPYYDKLINIDPLRAGVLYQYFRDMYLNLTTVYSLLRQGGQYSIIIGDSKIRGIDIPTHEVLAKIGEEAGFKWTNYFKYRIKDHRLSIPRKQNGGKIEFEHVITLSK